MGIGILVWEVKLGQPTHSFSPLDGVVLVDPEYLKERRGKLVPSPEHARSLLPHQPQYRASLTPRQDLGSSCCFLSIPTGSLKAPVSSTAGGALVSPSVGYPFPIPTWGELVNVPSTSSPTCHDHGKTGSSRAGVRVSFTDRKVKPGQ
jgi:hypothetical protein